MTEDRLFDPGSSVPGAVWGLDVSTRRVALAVQAEAGGGVSVGLLELAKGEPHVRLKLAFEALVPWLTAHPRPSLVGVEQPFASSMSKVHPQSFYMVGIVLAAVGLVAPAECVVEMLPPGTWKARSVGHGRASKPAILSWARRVHGLPRGCSSCGDGLEPAEGEKCPRQSAAHDEADAIGVCVAVREVVAVRMVLS